VESGVNRAERAAWRYLTRIALLWMFGLGVVGGVVGGLVMGERQMAATLPIGILLFVVVWKSGPKSADFLPEDENEANGG